MISYDGNKVSASNLILKKKSYGTSLFNMTTWSIWYLRNKIEYLKRWSRLNGVSRVSLPVETNVDKCMRN